MKFNVKAFAMNRKTRRQLAEPRVELIDTEENALFSGLATVAEIEQKYESFWNDLNPNSREIVKVMDVRRVPKNNPKSL